MKLMARESRFRLLKRSAVALAALATPAALYAQGCAMCYQTAAHSGSQFIHALKMGILVLFFPPMFIGLGIVRMAYRKRNQCAGEGTSTGLDR
jgi:hypothetical protein